MSPVSTDVSLEGLEDLDAVAAGTRRGLAGPVVCEQVLALLCGTPDDATVRAVLADEPARAELIESGWFTAQGEPGPHTKDLRRELEVSRTSLELRATDARGVRRGWVCAGRGLAVVAFEQAPLSPTAEPATTPRGAMTFETVPVSALPIVLARWGGLAPTWNYDAVHELSDAFAVDARVVDRRTPPPEGADDGLRDLWSRPWTRWSIRCDDLGIDAEYVAIEGAGHYVVRRSTSGATVLAPRPGGLVWGDLQKLVAGLPGLVAEDDLPDW